MRPYELLSRFYRRDWAEWGMQYARLVPWIATTYGCTIASVVDLACGIGVLLDELKRRDYEVIGVDLSPEMIAVAREINPGIEYIVQDIATATIRRSVDLAICSFDALNYFVEEERLRKTLENIRRMLRAGGFFTFDINTPLLYEKRQNGVIEREAQGVKFRQLLSYDARRRVATTVFDFGEGRQEVHVQKAYRIDEMKGFLRSAGFDILGVHEDFRMVSARDSTVKPLFVARRRESPVL